MTFLIDHQLPPLLAAFLRERGHSCRHVSECGMETADDRAIWAHVCREGCVLVSKDEDFLFLAGGDDDAGQLVWVRLGNCRNAALLDAFGRLLDGLVLNLESGQCIVEMR